MIDPSLVEDIVNIVKRNLALKFENIELKKKLEEYEKKEEIERWESPNIQFIGEDKEWNWIYKVS